MERGSSKHSPRMDEALEGEVRGMMSAGRETRAEDWNSAEPSGEDQPDVDRVPDGTMAGGVPDGMTEQDVETRSQLASYLGKECWPATRDDVLAKATDLGAPDAVLTKLRELPDGGTTYENMQELWTALHGGTEAHRF